MSPYQTQLNRFEDHRQNHTKSGVLDSDLPFLYAKPEYRTGILLLHGSGASPCNSQNLGLRLFQKGYTVLGGLFRGHGTPDQLQSGDISWEDCYLSAAEYLDSLKVLVDKVYVIGSSFGGSIAYLMGMDYKKDLSGVIAISAPSLTRMKANDPWTMEVEACILAVQENIRLLNLPTLILHGSDDKSVKVKNALHAYNHISTPHKKLIIYNQIGHSVGFGFNTAEVAEDIDAFIKYYGKLVPTRFEFSDIGVKQVHLVGEFNDWNTESHPMVFNNGKWQTVLLLRPGDYQYKYLLNQNHWILDPTSDTIHTPHGHKNSVVKIG